MAVSKRARFEVLRRDKFRCYYCGTRGNETTGAGLTVDHVTPVALGGSDDPSNLVAACGDCNSGKSATPADAETVADVDAAAAVYAQARAQALRALEANLEAADDYSAQVLNIWREVVPGYVNVPRDIDSFAESWYKRGVPLALARKALRIAWDGPAGRSQKLAYAAGVIRKMMADAEDTTRALVAGENSLLQEASDEGWREGYDYALWCAGQASRHFDYLAQHVDAQKLSPSTYDDRWMRSVHTQTPSAVVQGRFDDAA